MSAQRKNIFMVDDNEVNLLMGKKALSEQYNVFTLNSGERLFKALEKLIPDLILLDVNMPEMGGYEILERLKENSFCSHIPVIFLTSLSGEDTELKGLSMGAVDYIVKPFSPSLLLKRVELHVLVHSQKLELLNYSSNLEKMVEKKAREVTDLKNAVLMTVAELVEQRDAFTGSHIDRTQRYLRVLIDAMKEHNVYGAELSSMDEKLVIRSSQLHDVGKISIRDTILLKPSKLSPEETKEMKKHTTFGGNIISHIQQKTSDDGFLEYARIFALYHHEKWDGSGYPGGYKGEAIPFLGRIMAIADVYDALVTERVYKEAFSHYEAVSIIQNGKGEHFDPVLTDLFLDSHKKFEEIAQKYSADAN